jgi:hypothetical protein
MQIDDPVAAMAVRLRMVRRLCCFRQPVLHHNAEEHLGAKCPDRYRHGVR